MLVNTRLPHRHNSVAFYCQSVSAANRPGSWMCEQETRGARAQHGTLPGGLLCCLGDKANDINTIRGREFKGRWRWPWPLPWYHTPGQRHLSSGAWLLSWTPQPSPLLPPIGREGFYRRVYSLSGPEGRMLGCVDLGVPSAQSAEVSRPLRPHSFAEGIRSPDFQLSEPNDTRL